MSENNRPDVTEELFRTGSLNLDPDDRSDGWERWNADPRDADRALMLGMRLLRRLQSESDRSLVVVGIAFLDEMLLRLLRELMVPGAVGGRLLSHKGVLGTIGAKVDACEAFGVLHAEAAAEIRDLASIRNKFAHRIDVDSLEHLAKSCESLRAVSKWMHPTSVLDVHRTPRGRFESSVRFCILAMVAEFGRRKAHRPPSGALGYDGSGGPHGVSPKTSEEK